MQNQLSLSSSPFFTKSAKSSAKPATYPRFDEQPQSTVSQTKLF